MICSLGKGMSDSKKAMYVGPFDINRHLMATTNMVMGIFWKGDVNSLDNLMYIRFKMPEFRL